MLTWVIEAAPPERQSVEDIALCMLNVNFSALHTTAMVRLPPLLVALSEFKGNLRPSHMHSFTLAQGQSTLTSYAPSWKT